MLKFCQSLESYQFKLSLSGYILENGFQDLLMVCRSLNSVAQHMLTVSCNFGEACQPLKIFCTIMVGFSHLLAKVYS